MTDTHQFLMLVSRMKMNRLGAYRMAGAPLARRLAPEALTRCLETAASRRPTRRYRQRLLGYAERAAIYSGVSSQRSSGAR